MGFSWVYFGIIEVLPIMEFGSIDPEDEVDTSFSCELLSCVSTYRRGVKRCRSSHPLFSILLFFFFKWDWSLNSGFHAGTLLLEPCLQFILLWLCVSFFLFFTLVILEMVSCELFSQAGLDPQSSRSQLPK
jgi:hypothetical protein